MRSRRFRVPVLLLGTVSLLPFALLVVPANATGQTVYDSDPGFYLLVAPRSPIYLGMTPERTWSFGGGLRLSDRWGIVVRVARGEDVAPGNPLPVTYIGQTVAALRVSRVARPSSDDGHGVLVGASVLVVVADSSKPVSDAGADRSHFRGGARITDYALRVEGHRLSARRDVGGLSVHSRVGLLVEVQTRLDATIRHSPEGPTGTVSGGSEMAVAAAIAVGLSAPLGSRVRLVIEPYVLVSPGPYFIPAFTGGLDLTLNF